MLHRTSKVESLRGEIRGTTVSHSMDHTVSRWAVASPLTAVQLCERLQASIDTVARGLATLESSIKQPSTDSMLQQCQAIMAAHAASTSTVASLKVVLDTAGELVPTAPSLSLENSQPPPSRSRSANKKLRRMDRPKWLDPALLGDDDDDDIADDENSSETNVECVQASTCGGVVYDLLQEWSPCSVSTDSSITTDIRGACLSPSPSLPRGDVAAGAPAAPPRKQSEASSMTTDYMSHSAALFGGVGQEDAMPRKPATQLDMYPILMNTPRTVIRNRRNHDAAAKQHNECVK
eukprot:PhM_4_TR226/c0_g1_i1/m.100116